MTAHGGRGDGYLGDEQVGLDGEARPRTAGPPPQPPAEPGVVAGVASNVRRDTQPYGQNVSWQIVTFEVERRDGSGRPVGRVAVELRGLSLNGPIPAEGSAVRAYGRFGRDGVFHADRVVNDKTGHTLKGTMRRSARVLQWVVGVIAVAFLAVIVGVFISMGRTADDFFERFPGGPPTGFDEPQSKPVVVPDLKGMNQSEAAAALERAGFSLFDYRMVQKNSGSVAFGKVIGTDPAPGTSLHIDGRTTRLQVHVSVGRG